MRNRFGKRSPLSPENFVIPWGPGHGRTLADVAADDRLLRVLLGHQWDQRGWTFGALFLDAVINVYHSRPRARAVPRAKPRPRRSPAEVAP
jgi:hypothetical protein